MDNPRFALTAIIVMVGTVLADKIKSEWVGCVLVAAAVTASGLIEFVRSRRQNGDL